MVGGCGCGVVVWELYSEREHLADEMSRAAMSCGGLVFESCPCDFVDCFCCSLLEGCDHVLWLWFCVEVFKGTRWMPWHQEPMKDVGICDKPGGVDNRTLRPGFPNGETPYGVMPYDLQLNV